MGLELRQMSTITFPGPPGLEWCHQTKTISQLSHCLHDTNAHQDSELLENTGTENVPRLDQGFSQSLIRCCEYEESLLFGDQA